MDASFTQLSTLPNLPNPCDRLEDGSEDRIAGAIYEVSPPHTLNNPISDGKRHRYLDLFSA
jgi:hypothetical protein